MQALEDFADTGPMQVVAPASTEPQHLPIRFTGSGSEYFRIWIVNLLLTLVTLTLYWPFARARRMAYFQNNTLIGDDPLGFHADPWKMFRGYLVVMVLGVAYWAITNFLPSIGWMALVLVAALWPLLWRASLQFRLRNTSWRGVRLDFVGDTRGAYFALLPFFAPALVLVLLVPQGVDDAAPAPAAARGAAMVAGLVTLVFAVATPWLLLRLKRYQHGGYAFTQERTGLQVRTGSFYALYAKAAGVTLACVLLVLALMSALFFVVMGMGQREALESLSRPGAAAGGVVAVLVGGLALLYLLVPLVTLPYFTARFQNLLWSGTRSKHLLFQSRLRFRDLLRVNVVNWVLIILTLGLFWPFAKVRATRVRLQAMAVQVDGNVNDWLARAQASGRGVLGDAVGDFLGIDMGL
ncbi:MAG: DUF898 domain-containing protein [Rhodoferax sp.]|jgi:uncharacterized membrane protein YjgN (DUF898 family)|nr:DUF898 domain-containing protein [Rhodoferax sp.]